MFDFTGIIKAKKLASLYRRVHYSYIPGNNAESSTGTQTMRPKLNDIVYILQALNLGRFIITDWQKQAKQTYIYLESEHQPHLNGWRLRGVEVQCWTVAIARPNGIIESMDCDYQPEKYQAVQTANNGIH